MKTRIFATGMGEENWFGGLPTPYKQFWNHAWNATKFNAVFDVDIKMYNHINKAKIESSEALSIYNKGRSRVHPINDHQWLMLDFIRYHYHVALIPQNMAFYSIIKTWEEMGVDIEKAFPSIRVTESDSPLGTEQWCEDLISIEFDDLSQKAESIERPSSKKIITKEDSFEEFWARYHKITGMPKTDRDSALKYWKRLTKEEEKKAVASIQQYKDSCRIGFIKKARTYLHDKNFNDQFSPVTKVGKPTDGAYKDFIF